MNYISYDGEQSSSLIKAIPFGVLPSGASITKTLLLGTSGAAGDRVIDISVQSRSTTSGAASSGSDSPQSPHAAHADTGETLKTLVVPTIEPITFASQVSYKRSSNSHASLADLATYEDDHWDDSNGGEAHIVTTVSCVGPTGIIIESVKLIRQVGPVSVDIQCFSAYDIFCQDGPHGRVVDSILDESEEDFLEGMTFEFRDPLDLLMLL